MAANRRQYDLVLWGASGYTGKYTAEQLVRLAPTNLRWAVAGRSAAKLEAVVEDVKSINPDRTPPSIETCSLESEDFTTLVKKTTVIINAVGPYILYGEPVMKACIENNTHYLDTTGEVAWVRRMLNKYEEQAKSSSAIIVAQAGFESAMTDLMTLTLVNTIREKHSTSTRSVTASLHGIKTLPSGGSLNTILTNVANIPLTEFAASTSPFTLVPDAYKQKDNRSWVQRFFGLRTVQGLGMLTTAFTTTTNAPIVQRSNMLLDYGPHLRYEELGSAGNPIRGIAIHWIFSVGPLLLKLAPIRWLLRLFVYQPGQGPTRDSVAEDGVEYRAIATADSDRQPPLRAMATSSYKGSIYDLTGIYLAAAALTLLHDDCRAKEMGGGFLTPATLGQGYIERCRGAGVRLETKMFEE